MSKIYEIIGLNKDGSPLLWRVPLIHTETPRSRYYVCNNTTIYHDNIDNAENPRFVRVTTKYEVSAVPKDEVLEYANAVDRKYKDTTRDLISYKDK